MVAVKGESGNLVVVLFYCSTYMYVIIISSLYMCVHVLCCFALLFV